MIARGNMTVVSAIMWLTLGGFACGEDPVLRAAREEAEADRASAKKASTGGSPDSKVRSQRGHPMDGGTPGGSSTPQGEGAVTAEDPLPGVPEEPTPAPPGTPGGGACVILN